MTRSERLFRIISILNERGDATIPALADSLKVSERTVYRDIKTLSRVGFATRQSVQQIKSAKNIEDEITSLSDMAIKLIVFALMTHNLRKVFPFEAIARRIDADIANKFLDNPHDINDHSTELNRLSPFFDESKTNEN